MRLIKISILVLLTLGVGYLIALAFFLKGTLVVKPSVSGVNVLIDKKEYKDIDSLGIKVRVGSHKVKVSRDGYVDFEETVGVGIGEVVEVNAALNLNQESKDKQVIEKLGKDFVEAWYNYATQTDPSYLAKIKPFMIDSFYEPTEYVAKHRPQDFKDQPALSTKVLSVEITNYSQSEASAVVERESTDVGTGKKKVGKVRVSFSKVGNKWLVRYLDLI